MVRSTMRRAAALAGVSALAVLAAAGPALAADSPTPQTQAAAVAAGPAPAPAQQAQQGAAQDQAPTPADGPRYIIWCHHHHEGLLSGLLEGVGDLLGALL